MVAWVPVLAHWHSRRLLGQTVHVTRPAALPGPRELELPGIPGRLSVTGSPGLGAALVLDRRAGTVTAIARVHAGGFLLEDGAGQDRKVTGWGRVLAAACQQDAVVRVQVLHRTLPGGAATARRWWARHALTGSAFAARVLADLVTDAETTTDRHETLLAVALRVPPRTGRALSPAGAATVERHLTSLADALTSAELTVDGWVTPGRLGAVLRSSYDPDGAAHARTDGGDGDVAVSRWSGRWVWPSPGTGSAPTPRATPCTGWRSGRAATCTPASCSPCSWPPAPVGRSP